MIMRMVAPSISIFVDGCEERSHLLSCLPNYSMDVRNRIELLELDILRDILVEYKLIYNTKCCMLRYNTW